jgi:hypothetical protein
MRPTFASLAIGGLLAAAAFGLSPALAQSDSGDAGQKLNRTTPKVHAHITQGAPAQVVVVPPAGTTSSSTTLNADGSRTTTTTTSETTGYVAAAPVIPGYPGSTTTYVTPSGTTTYVTPGAPTTGLHYVAPPSTKSTDVERPGVSIDD